MYIDTDRLNIATIGTILKSHCHLLNPDCMTSPLLDMRMPKMYGHELYDEMKKILRAAFPTIEIECYIQKPVEIKDLVRRINVELEQ